MWGECQCAQVARRPALLGGRLGFGCAERLNTRHSGRGYWLRQGGPLLLLQSLCEPRTGMAPCPGARPTQRCDGAVWPQ